MRFLNDCRIACRRHHIRPTRHLLVASVARQQLLWLVRSPHADPLAPDAYRLHRRFTASTSRFGIGQVRDSQRTPLGLHRIGAKIGRGWPVGTVFRARVPIGLTWNGLPQATIAHRILWLDGLEPGFNQGGDVDTRSRFIYIHGLSDEPSLGRPASHGCVHLAAQNMIPLFDQIPLHSLVWIAAQP
jgi:hypothetical protein